MQVVLGIGCDRNCGYETLRQAVTEALHTVGLTLTSVTAVASIDKKSDEVALLQLAADNRWLITFFSAEELSSVTVPNPSEVVRKYVGTPAVAEAAALLLAKRTMEQLLVEKYRYLGADGKNATVSVVPIAQ